MYCFFCTYARFSLLFFNFFAYFDNFLYLCSVKVQIMAIGNVTPDSFYGLSRLANAGSVVEWAHRALADGADILDIGGCSTRPGSTPVSEEAEWARLEPALKAIRQALPEVSLSLDTFRPEIAHRALEQFGPMIINDISGGSEAMYEIVRTHDVPYVYTIRGDYDKLHLLDAMPEGKWIIDPGFGFCGGVEQDYECLRKMDILRAYDRPVLVGLSRKSMLWKPLGLTPDTCLCATQVVQFYALQHGATILRVHDVKEARQTIQLFESLELRV